MNMKSVQLSNEDLLLELIYERDDKRTPLEEKELEKILNGSYSPEMGPFKGIQFDYSPEDKEELMWDITTLAGVGDIIEEWKNNPGRYWILSESGRLNLEMIKRVLAEYSIDTKAVKSNIAPISLF